MPNKTSAIVKSGFLRMALLLFAILFILGGGLFQYYYFRQPAVEEGSPHVKACEALADNNLTRCLEIETAFRVPGACSRLYHITNASRSKNENACEPLSETDQQYNFCKTFVSMDSSICSEFEGTEKELCFILADHNTGGEINAIFADVADVELLELYYYLIAVYNEDINLCGMIKGDTNVSKERLAECKAVISGDSSFCKSIMI